MRIAYLLLIVLLAVAVPSVAAEPEEESDSPMSARFVRDARAGYVEVRENDRPVLRYLYHTVPIPEGFFDDIPAKHQSRARKYAVPRSDYIHPIYGLDGQELTADWNKDHGHHRGLYWAWPEVGYRGELGDLHALQKVWARPTGHIELRRGGDWAEIEAENRWMWEDKTPIVREHVTIRAWKAGEHGRYIDLTLHIEGLEEGVTLARRGKKAYGGLNLRLAPIRGLKMVHHADPASAGKRMAWQAATGTWQGAKEQAVLAVFEHVGNPHYPGDYVQYPNLPWFQPTFPRAGVRYPLKKGEPLVLGYRLWIRRGEAPTEADYRRQWGLFNDEP